MFAIVYLLIILIMPIVIGLLVMMKKIDFKLCLSLTIIHLAILLVSSFIPTTNIDFIKMGMFSIIAIAEGIILGIINIATTYGRQRSLK